MKAHSFANNIVVDDTAVIEEGVVIGEKIEYIPFEMGDITQSLHGKFLTLESYTLAQRLMVFKEEELF